MNVSIGNYCIPLAQLFVHGVTRPLFPLRIRIGVSHVRLAFNTLTFPCDMYEAMFHFISWKFFVQMIHMCCDS